MTNVAAAEMIAAAATFSPEAETAEETMTAAAEYRKMIVAVMTVPEEDLFPPCHPLAEVQTMTPAAVIFRRIDFPRKKSYLLAEEADRKFLFRSGVGSNPWIRHEVHVCS